MGAGGERSVDIRLEGDRAERDDWNWGLHLGLAEKPSAVETSWNV